MNHLANGAIPLEHLLERRVPRQAFAREPRPEALEVALGFLVELGLGVGLGGEGWIGREAPALGHQVLDLGRGQRARQGGLGHVSLLVSSVRRRC